MSLVPEGNVLPSLIGENSTLKSHWHPRGLPQGKPFNSDFVLSFVLLWAFATENFQGV